MVSPMDCIAYALKLIRLIVSVPILYPTSYPIRYRVLSVKTLHELRNCKNEPKSYRYRRSEPGGAGAPSSIVYDIWVPHARTRAARTHARTHQPAKPTWVGRKPT